MVVVEAQFQEFTGQVLREPAVAAVSSEDGSGGSGGGGGVDRATSEPAPVTAPAAAHLSQWLERDQKPVAKSNVQTRK